MDCIFFLVYSLIYRYRFFKNILYSRERNHF